MDHDSGHPYDLGMATAKDRRVTDSGVEVKPVYTAGDLPPEELEQLGEYPYTQGPYSTM